MSPQPLDAHEATSAMAFVIDLTYVVPLDVIDELLDAHNQHLASAFSAGLFLLAGPKVPRTGGVILAEGSREDVERFVAADPFIRAEAATARVTEFVPKRRSPRLPAVATPAAG